MKKTLIIMLSIIMALCTLCFVGCNGDGRDTDEPGLYFKKYKDDNYYTVYKYVDDGETTSLNIGDYNINGVSIGRIKNGAFSGNTTLTEIIVPDSVEVIDEGAFNGAQALQSITLPFIGGYYNADATLNQTASTLEGEKAIGKQRNFGYIFGESSYNHSVAVSQNNNESSTTTFYLPENLTEVKLSPKYGDNGYKIPMYAFYQTTIEKVVLNDNVTEIGEYAFAECVMLEEINISKNVKTIYKNAFECCEKLNEGFVIDSDSTLKTIGDSAFENTGIRTFTMPSTVETIGKKLFAGSKITTVNLGNVDKISDYAFYNAEYLTTVTTTATKIGVYAFDGCDKLNSFNSSENYTINLANVTELGAMSFAEIENAYEYTVISSPVSTTSPEFIAAFFNTNLKAPA